MAAPKQALVLWGSSEYLDFERLEEFVFMSDTAAQSGKLALCCLLSALLCQESCICHQMRALTALYTTQEADLDHTPQH